MLLISSLFAGISLGIAWLMPISAAAALGGWISAWAFAYSFAKQKNASKLSCFVTATIGGMLAQGLACFWLIHTISHFGKFPLIAAIAIFVLFVVAHGVQFGCAALVYRMLPAASDRFFLRVPLAWITAEILYPSLFPWMYGHTQLSFAPLAQAADLGGVPLISFVMWWSASALTFAPRTENSLSARLPALLMLSILVAYGSFALSRSDITSAPKFSAVLVQANISTEDKRDMTMVVTNEARYRELSAPHADTPSLIVWPETVIQRWIQEDDQTAIGELPRLAPQATLLTGALSYNKERESFNSAFVVPPRGEIPLPYHKQILMPFGEYVPFVEQLPWLTRFTGPIGGFARGKDVNVFPVHLKENDKPLTVAPLICYEDIVPSLARDATNKGAEVLVNITNDAWFGNSAAPFQHHLIAAFRAIENRRPLIRSTNTGFTAYVDPFGRTVASLPLFQDGTLQIEVPQLKIQTVYTKIGHMPWYLLAAFTLLMGILRAAAYRGSALPSDQSKM